MVVENVGAGKTHDLKEFVTRDVGRLAMRHEGDWWVAYYALPNTMEGALEMGRLKMALVMDVLRKKMFMDIMRDAIADILEEKTGVRPMFHGEKPAPEHERSGHS